MKDFKAPIATDGGLRAQMAYFSINRPVVLTKMAIGSGKPSDLSEIPYLTDLIKIEKEIPITELKLDTENPCVTICGVIDYMEIETSFEVCELGLFILDPVANEETLYCYSYTERSELAPAKVNATELINISTLISRTQEVTIPEIARPPYVLRDEMNALKTLVAHEEPNEIYDIWLKPIGKIEGWENWSDVSGIIADIGVGQALNLTGSVFGENPPESTELLWIKPLDISVKAGE